MTLINPKQIAATDGSVDLASQLRKEVRTLQPVVNVTDLPTEGNEDGDTRLVRSKSQFYYWDATLITPSWQPSGASASPARGTAFPGTGLFSGYQFYRTDLELLFIYNGTSQAWVQK